MFFRNFRILRIVCFFGISEFSKILCFFGISEFSKISDFFFFPLLPEGEMKIHL